MPSLRSHQYSPYAPAKTHAKKIDAVSSRAVEAMLPRGPGGRGGDFSLQAPL